MGFLLLYVLCVVIGLRLFDAQSVGAALALLSLFALALEYYRRGSIEWLALPPFALIIGLLVALLDAQWLLKLLPVFLSSLFMAKFADAWFRQRPFLGATVAKFPYVKLTEPKLAYIDRSHGYWMGVNVLNTFVQVAVLFAPLHIWALYTTLGWYLLFAAALAAQIIYGRLHGV